MPHGNGAAVDIQLVHRNGELIAAVDYLHREGLVQLPQIDIVYRKTITLNSFGTANKDPDPFLPVHSLRLESAKNQLVRNAQLIGPLARHE